jgi:AbrB family looped-hinge helix DNA binding protein
MAQRASARKTQPAGRHLAGRGKVSSKGWVVIPKEIRDEMGLTPGDEVSFVLWPPAPGMKQDRALMSLHMQRLPDDPAMAIAGMIPLNRKRPSSTELLLREHRDEVAREERELRRTGRRRRPPA